MNSIIANRIFNIVANDPAKIAILSLLADGKWHTHFEVETAAKDQRATIGLVGVCIILKAFQDADLDLFQTYDNDSGRFYKLNPQRVEMIKKIIEINSKNSKDPITASATQFKLFKEKVKSVKKESNTNDESLKQFL